MKTRFMHCGFYNGKELFGQGGATIAVKIEDDNLNIGLSLCSVKDNYNRSIGRAIALGRANNGKYEIRIKPANIDNWHQTKEEIILAVSTALKNHTTWLKHQAKNIKTELALLPLRRQILENEQPSLATISPLMDSL